MRRVRSVDSQLQDKLALGKERAAWGLDLTLLSCSLQVPKHGASECSHWEGKMPSRLFEVMGIDSGSRSDHPTMFVCGVLLPILNSQPCLPAVSQENQKKMSEQPRVKVTG